MSEPSDDYDGWMLRDRESRVLLEHTFSRTRAGARKKADLAGRGRRVEPVKVRQEWVVVD